MRVKCKSGLQGSQHKLRSSYKNFEEFEAYCETYNLHARLGFVTPEDAWDENPIIQSSTEPSDLKVVK